MEGMGVREGEGQDLVADSQAPPLALDAVSQALPPALVTDSWGPFILHWSQIPRPLLLHWLLISRPFQLHWLLIPRLLLLHWSQVPGALSSAL